MDRLELLTQAQAAGIRVKAEGEMLSITGPSSATALVKQLLACKDDILLLLSQCPLEASGALSDAISSHPIPTAEEHAYV